ncbi:MAG: glycoside hydrolase family 25 protein [Chthoniobacter sp.]|nr:glycoside hydrolase family 25 protein [Chthoniobacter sp.]
MSLRYAGRVLILLALALTARAENSVLSLSHYDERTSDFSSLQRSGLGAIIHEATYPAFDYDAKYAYRQEEAMKAGLLWGAYHFANASDGRKQADHFINFVGAKWAAGHNPAQPSGVLLVLDAEQNTHYPGGSMNVDQAVRFIERVHERTGIYPGLYSNENWLKRVFGDPTVSSNSRETLRKCWLWIANYHKPPATTSPWDHWTLWQYTGDGVCQLPRSRYPTNLCGMRKVERTIFSGDRASLRRFWAEHSWMPEKELVAKE